MKVCADFQMPEVNHGKPEITMAPLVDVVFLLLIFFMVTTVFPQNEGLVIEKPASENAVRVDDEPLKVQLDQNGRLYYDERAASLEDIERLLKEDLQGREDGAVLIEADQGSTTRDLVALIDAIKRSGADSVGLATDAKRAD